MLFAKWIGIYIFYILAAIVAIPVIGATLWIYWWIFKFAQREDVNNPDAESRLVEKLSGDPLATIPQNRQLPARFLAGGFLLAAWPIALIAAITFGLLGVSMILIFSLCVFWYFWERTAGFCKRVKTGRQRIRGKG